MDAYAGMLGDALVWLSNALIVTAVVLPVLGLVFTVVLLLSPGLLARCGRVQICLPGRRDSRERRRNRRPDDHPIPARPSSSLMTSPTAFVAFPSAD